MTDLGYYLSSITPKANNVLHVTLDPITSDKEISRQVQSASQCVIDALGENIPHTVVATSAYNMHALISTKYRNGHCFLAGDSAHQWLPAGGLGMNVGVADAANLAWKLEAILNGYGGTHLLDLFKIERRAIADSTRHFALSLGYTSYLQHL